MTVNNSNQQEERDAFRCFCEGFAAEECAGTLDGPFEFDDWFFCGDGGNGNCICL